MIISWGKASVKETIPGRRMSIYSEYPASISNKFIGFGTMFYYPSKYTAEAEK